MRLKGLTVFSMGFRKFEVWPVIALPVLFTTLVTSSGVVRYTQETSDVWISRGSEQMKSRRRIELLCIPSRRCKYYQNNKVKVT